ncbi:hypothetical protein YASMINEVIRUS_1552 [Yasminevirus sp. GU-2018]|uniref:Methyltransferase domain-containing protein n=1 Tax=Yasminevirus sp. GU-2018 TaxID=2420051 RepID=A0A5K0UBK2_9VIRU|nr:hypothetical protein YASMINEVIRUS_1552 [Yasminevirus sp. GU-2018]
MSEADAIYQELMRFSGPHTDLGKVSKTLTGHDIYGSYHLEGFTKTNALRNTQVRFDEFLVPDSLEGKKVFDIGCCLGSLSFECARRKCSSVTGFEYCNERVNVCNKLAKHLNLNNIQFIQSDINEKSKDVDSFIKNHGTADIVFCCALDAYVDKERLYSFVSKISKDVCFFETNSGIDVDTFISIMKGHGFEQIVHLGTSKSDIGYGRRSYIMRKTREVIVNRIVNTQYDHVLSRFFNHIIIENIPFDNSKNQELVSQYNSYESEMIRLYKKISHIKYVAPTKFYYKACVRKFYENPLITVDDDESRKKVREQIVDLVRQMNKAGVAHRDMHINNFYFEKGEIVLCDFEFLCSDTADINNCYDLTGTGLESPLGSNFTHVLIDDTHPNYEYSFNRYLSSGKAGDTLTLTLNDF